MSNADARNVRTLSISVRFTEAENDRIDQHLGRMIARHPRLQISRTDAIRDILLRGLDDADRR